MHLSMEEVAKSSFLFCELTNFTKHTAWILAFREVFIFIKMFMLIGKSAAGLITYNKLILKCKSFV